MEPWSAPEYLHGTVWPFLVADKVVGGKHHLTDITVKASFMPVLTDLKKQKNGNLIVISHTSSQRINEGKIIHDLYLWCGPLFSILYQSNTISIFALCFSCDLKIVRCLNPYKHMCCQYQLQCLWAFDQRMIFKLYQTLIN